MAVRYTGRPLTHRVIIPDVVLIQLSSWGWAQSCSKHVEDSNKHIIEEIVRQVGHLSERTFSEVYSKRKTGWKTKISKGDCQNEICNITNITCRYIKKRDLLKMCGRGNTKLVLDGTRFRENIRLPAALFLGKSVGKIWTDGLLVDLEVGLCVEIHFVFW